MLTSCGDLNQKSPVDKIKEDNLAHEELFGKLNPKRMDPEPASEWNLAPKVGVQHATYEIEEQTYYAVRYVAAISGLADGVTASWTRAVAGKDATIVKAQSDGHLSTVTYDTLNNNGTPMTATDEGSGYTKYIVYTIYDIPASQKDSFMMAYLTLSKEAEEPVVSKAIATRLAGTYFFSFDNSTRGYFLGGNFNNTNEVITPNAEADEHSYAIFQNMDIRRTDYFGVFNYTGEEFKYYGFSSFYTNSTTHFMNDNEIAKPKYRGDYVIKVSKDEETRNQVLITRNTIRFDATTSTYTKSVWDKVNKCWVPPVNTITLNGRDDDIIITPYGCAQSNSDLVIVGGDSYSTLYLNTDYCHIFNMKSIAFRYTKDVSTSDNYLELETGFLYNPEVDNYIYGNEGSYRENWESHTYTQGDGTYTVNFESKDVGGFAAPFDRMHVYPNYFTFKCYKNTGEGAVNAEYYIEYIEITFANEKA